MENGAVKKELGLGWGGVRVRVLEGFLMVVVLVRRRKKKERQAIEDLMNGENQRLDIRV